jgi:hypothetical protein
MKSLKTIIGEGILDDIDTNIEHGTEIANIMANKATRAELLAKCTNNEWHNSWYTFFNDADYEKIKTCCFEANKKAGSRWNVIVPYPTNKNIFKPLMVNFKKGLYRVPDEKELYNGTNSAIRKRLKKAANTAKLHNVSKAYVFNSVFNMYALISEYFYLTNNGNNVENLSVGDNIFTIAGGLDLLGKGNSMHAGLENIPMSINADTGEWAVGTSNMLPSYAWFTPDKTIHPAWIALSKCIYDTLLKSKSCYKEEEPREGIEYTKTYTDLTPVLSKMPDATATDIYKSKLDDWIPIMYPAGSTYRKVLVNKKTPIKHAVGFPYNDLKNSYKIK